MFPISLLASQRRGLGSQSQSTGHDWWAFYRQQELERSDALGIVTAKCSVFPHLKGWSVFGVSFMSVEKSKSCYFILRMTPWSNKIWGKTVLVDSLIWMWKWSLLFTWFLGVSASLLWLREVSYEAPFRKKPETAHFSHLMYRSGPSPSWQGDSHHLTGGSRRSEMNRWVCHDTPQTELLCRLTFKSCDCSFCSYSPQTPAGWVNFLQQSICSARVIQPRAGAAFGGSQGGEKCL